MVRAFASLLVGLGVLAPLLATAPANAQATRTWVSGVGDDVNPCSRTAPCKTFAGAISKTAASGEINCMDPGAFGSVTITKSITINCEEMPAGILVSGTNGIVVSGAGIIVNIRGLDIDGVSAGASGINIIQAGAVYIRKSVIWGFQTGISFTGAGTLVVNDTVVHSNSSTGILLNGGNATLRDVIAHGNSATGIGIVSGRVLIDSSTLAFNGYAGLAVTGSAFAVIGNSTITENNNGVVVGAGTLYSLKN